MGGMETPHQSLVAAVQRALNAADPIRLIAMGAPDDEYSPEIAAILPKLAAAELDRSGRISREG
jgi:hypothetical protein